MARRPKSESKISAGTRVRLTDQYRGCLYHISSMVVTQTTGLDYFNLSQLQSRHFIMSPVITWIGYKNQNQNQNNVYLVCRYRYNVKVIWKQENKLINADMEAPIKGALYRIWCGVHRLSDSGVKVVWIYSAILQLLFTRRVSYC